MIIDTKKTEIRLQLSKLFFLLLLVVLIVPMYTVDSIIQSNFVFYRKYVALGLVFLYALWYFFNYIRDVFYVYVNTDSSKIIFRYYSLRPLSNETNAIEIPKADFVKFEIEKKWSGYREYIILYQKTLQGVAKYPPISIAILKKEEKEKLLNALKNLQ